MMLAPLSVLLGLIGVGAFLWTVKSRQYDDPAGDAARILIDDPEDRPL
jgi:cbb3-type cytochrome oxidase maturation protein